MLSGAELHIFGQEKLGQTNFLSIFFLAKPFWGRGVYNNALFCCYFWNMISQANFLSFFFLAKTILRTCTVQRKSVVCNFFDILSTILKAYHIKVFSFTICATDNPSFIYSWSIWKSYWRHTMLDGAKFWINYWRLACLSLLTSVP